MYDKIVIYFVVRSAFDAWLTRVSSVLAVGRARRGGAVAVGQWCAGEHAGGFVRVAAHTGGLRRARGTGSTADREGGQPGGGQR